MIENNTKQKLFLARVIDFVVLGSTFYVSCSILSQDMGANLSFQALIYATVILIAIRFGRNLLGATLGSFSRVARLMLGNAIGLGIGAIVLSVLSLLYPQFVGTVVAIVVSSIIAFFILGTLTPLLIQQHHTSVR